MYEARSAAPAPGSATNTAEQKRARGQRDHDATGTVESAESAAMAASMTETGGRGTQALPPLNGAQGEAGLNDDKGKLKLDDVFAACRSNDIAQLRALAASPGGLVHDNARRAAWPILLGYASADKGSEESWQDLTSHRDEDQVALDVNRSFVYYPRGETEQRTLRRKAELSDTIINVLRRHPHLCYFQGYHDIVQVFLLVLGADAAVPAVERLSMLRIRDFMLPTMSGALSHLSLLPAILSAADRELYQHLSQTAPFYFALSATLTLYAHEIQEYGDIARLFDFLLASESVMSIYFFTIIICSRKKQLLELEAHEHDMLHSILSKLPNPLDLDDLITQTADLFRSHPPERLGGLSWYQISANSVLKTTRSFPSLLLQTLAEGKAYFLKHAEEIRRQDERRKQLQELRRVAARYRRPILVTGSAITVALLALYLRKPPTAVRTVLEWGHQTIRQVVQR